MKILQNIWLLAIVGLFINLGVVMGTIYSMRAQYLPDPAEAEAHSEEPDKNTPEYWTFAFTRFEEMQRTLNDKEVELNKRSQDLDDRKAALEAEMSELEEFRTSLANERNALTKILKEVGAEEEKNLKFLASTYSQMPPEQVVPILDEMEDEEVIKLLLQMKPDNIGAIFASMVTNDPDGKQAQRVAYFSKELMRYRRGGR
ncbi:MAG: hypothetical protein E1N59_84 [Puniceicoccaceae bacterium 5H]|nr:MAG: hypothetical protein E1N59_84 [Puniceicoccaceae bacterium 5H]